MAAKRCPPRCEHSHSRSAWPAPAQVAEVALRERHGVEAIDGVRLVSAAVDGDSAHVTLATDGADHAFVLRAERGEPRPISCRPDAPEAPLHWTVVGP